MFKIIAFILLSLRTIWAYVTRIPKSKIMTHLSNGILSVWNTALSYRTLSRNVLTEIDRLSPSKNFRRSIFSSQLMIRRPAVVTSKLEEENDDHWGFHSEMEADEQHPYVSAAKETLSSALNVVYSRVYTDNRKSTQIQVAESTDYSERVGLDGLWQWENDEPSAQQAAAASTSTEQVSKQSDISNETSSQTFQSNLPWHLLRLQRSPSFIRSLRRVLDRAHWVCRNAHTDYAAQVTIVGDELIVGFRGTANMRDVAVDLRIQPQEGPYGVHVHSGFLDVLKAVNKDNKLSDLIVSIVKKRNLKRVIVTGYSLGAAVANLFLLANGSEMRRLGIDMRAVTFGCPRFIETAESSLLPYSLTSRIINTYLEGDPIPLNLTSMLGFTDYCHVGNSMVVQSDGKGVRILEEPKEQNPDTLIQWWGLSTPLSHLTENYDAKLKLVEENLFAFQDAKYVSSVAY